MEDINKEFIYAVQDKDIDYVKLTIERGANVNFLNSRAFGIALKNKDNEMICLLLENNIDIKLHNNQLEKLLAYDDPNLKLFNKIFEYLPKGTFINLFSRTIYNHEKLFKKIVNIGIRAQTVDDYSKLLSFEHQLEYYVKANPNFIDDVTQHEDFVTILGYFIKANSKYIKPIISKNKEIINNIDLSFVYEADSKTIKYLQSEGLQLDGKICEENGDVDFLLSQGVIFGENILDQFFDEYSEHKDDEEVDIEQFDIINILTNSKQITEYMVQRAYEFPGLLKIIIKRKLYTNYSFADAMVDKDSVYILLQEDYEPSSQQNEITNRLLSFNDPRYDESQSLEILITHGYKLSKEVLYHLATMSVFYQIVFKYMQAEDAPVILNIIKDKIVSSALYAKFLVRKLTMICTSEYDNIYCCLISLRELKYIIEYENKLVELGIPLPPFTDDHFKSALNVYPILKHMYTRSKISSAKIIEKITTLKCFKLIQKKQPELFNDDVYEIILKNAISCDMPQFVNYYISKKLLPATHIIRLLLQNPDKNVLSKIDNLVITDEMVVWLPDGVEPKILKLFGATGPNMIIKMFHSTDVNLLKPIENLKEIITEHFDEIISKICCTEIIDLVIKLGFKLPESILCSPHLYKFTTLHYAKYLMKLYDNKDCFVKSGENIYEKCIFIAIENRSHEIISRCLKRIYNVDVINRAFVLFAKYIDNHITSEFLMAGADISYNNYEYMRTQIELEYIDNILYILPYVNIRDNNIIKQIFLLGCRDINLQLKEHIVFDRVETVPDDFECPICLEKKKEEVAKSFDCNHLFHDKCLRNWMSTCPICRK